MRHLNLKLLTALSIFFSACPMLSHADVITAKDTVTGTVIGKDKEPLPGAKVEIIGQPYSTYTDIDGRFNIKCEQGAKKVRVSYPKARDVKQKISPDMTVRIGRNWREDPENYQWFVDANIGIGITRTKFNRNSFDISSWDGLYYPDFDTYEKRFKAPSVSIMAGRVKAYGWYVRGFVTLPNQVDDNKSEKATTAGATAGVIFRLKCPLHLYYGLGFGYTDLSKTSRAVYNEWSIQFDMGLLYRFKDNLGISLGMSAGTSKDSEIITGSFLNLGLAYFLQ